MTERSTWDKSNLELFPGRFPLLPQIPPRSLLSQQSSKASSSYYLNPSGSTHPLKTQSESVLQYFGYQGNS